MIRSIFIFLGFLVLLSCNRLEDPITRFANKHPKGEVIPKVVCGNAPSYNYCLYLPKTYDPGTPMPVVYIFDPDGDGRLPVNLMKDSAEKLGYILVGSNNSRNGIDANEVRKIIRILLENTEQNLAIDKQRMYAAGFSGGARVACSMALSNSDIQGVIACSAGFRPGSQPPGFVFIGVAGVHDMNYLEVVRLTKYLQSQNAEVQMLTFNGKHGWPPVKTLDEALLMLNIYVMRNPETSVNKSLVDTVKARYTGRIEDLLKTGNPENKAKAFEVAEKAVSLFAGLINISRLQEIYSELKSDPQVQKLNANRDSLEMAEASKQQQLADAFNTKTASWWDRELDQLSQETADTIHQPTSDMAVRLLGFVSLNCYGMVSRALQQQNMDLLRFLNNIYLKSDPENYFAWYAQACIDSKSGKKEKALEDLRKSIQFGYPDKTKLKKDPWMAPLKDQPEFQELIGD